MKTMTFTDWHNQIQPRHEALYELKYNDIEKLKSYYDDIVIAHNNFVKLRKAGFMFLINESSDSFFKI
jgi:hypothetical protein